MKFLLSTKLCMAQVFREDGTVVPVTLLEAGPVVVTQIKKEEKDGYEAVQVGYGKKKHLTKSLRGHFHKLGSFRWIREYNIGKSDALNREAFEKISIGNSFDISAFEEGEKVTLSGLSKGKGFQGVVKRHGFAGGPKTHGNKKTLRAPGSIGSQFPQHVTKGRRMAGRMGQTRSTRRNVEIVRIDKESNLVAVKGAVPGARGSLIEILG